MNVLNNSTDDVVECPLCMEPLEVDDLNFFPCTCGYQICRFCWHRIRTDENELCPACRKAYPENPADFTPLSQEQIAALKAEKRQRDQQRKQKITENRKHLANVRVVQKNLVFVVGLPPRLADAEILKKYEYFGKYGKIHKVVINPSTTYAGVQGPSASAYVTYVHNNDALRAIQSVNNIMIDGRLIKTSLGTTKYCSHFMKNQQCPKTDCMYLHELGDSEASFTKEEMHQGKHQEYEKRLHDALIASSNALGTNLNSSSPSNIPPLPNGIQTSGSGGLNGVMNINNINNGHQNGPVQGKEAWPSLSVSPVNNNENKEKEITHNNKNNKNSKNHNGNNGGNNKENNNKKNEKSKSEKNKQKNQKGNNNNHNHNSNNHHNSNKDNKETTGGLKENNNTTNIQIIKQEQDQQQQHNRKDHHKNDKNNKESHKNRVNSLDDEINFISEQMDKEDSINGDDIKINKNSSNSNSSGGGRSLSSSSSTSSASSTVSSVSSTSSNNSDSVGSISDTASGKSSPGSFPENVNNVSTTTTTMTTNNNMQQQLQQHQQIKLQNEDMINKVEKNKNNSNIQNNSTTENIINQQHQQQQNGGVSTNSSDKHKHNQTSDTNNIIDTSACLSKLSLFDDNNSFFSSSFNPLLKGKLDNESRTLINNQLNSAISSHLPDLINGIDNYQNHTNHTGNNGFGGLSEDWEAAFKYVLMRNNKQIEEHQHQQQQQQQQPHHPNIHHHHHQQQQHLQQHPNQQPHHQQQPHSQDEYLRMQEIQKRNNLLNSIGMNHGNNLTDFGSDFGGSDIRNLSQQALFHQQHQQMQQRQAGNNMQNNDILANGLFGSTNMSKFFDFHKTQQQQQHPQHQFMSNGLSNGFLNDHRDNLNMANLIDASRIAAQLLEHNNSLAGQPFNKQRFNNINNKYDQMNGHPNNHSLLLNNQNNQINNPPPQPQPQQQPQPQNRIPNQFSQSSTVDDDLGFDPFIETQKALAELIENENQANNGLGHNNNKGHQPQQQQQHQQPTQQQNILDNQRSRMPPPGFNHMNHMNSFGFGGPRHTQQQQQPQPQPQPQGSKILPFMNMNGNQNNNGIGNNMPSNMQQQQTQNNWNQHLGGFSQQNPAQMNEHQQLQQHLQQNGGNNINKGGYGNVPDWTTIDPAILSFRQFPFSSQHHQQQQQQQQQQQHQQLREHNSDMFMQHLNPQNLQTGQGFGGHHGVNNLLNQQQQNSQNQINFSSHSNWLNNDQNLFMNSLGNNVYNNSNNGYDKFSIPMPPGMHSNNINLMPGNNKQKTECIN